MAWTTPKMWTDVVIDAADFNEQIRDNLLALKEPPSDNYDMNTGSNYSTNSNTISDVDATNLSFTITSNGGDVMVGFIGTVRGSAGSRAAAFYFNVNGTDGDIVALSDNTQRANLVGGTRIIQGLSAGTHTITLRWRTVNGVDTNILYALNAGTPTYFVAGQFWAREIS